MEVEALTNQIKTAGDEVRKLKSISSSRESIAAAVEKLLALKAEYEAKTGTPFDPPKVEKPKGPRKMKKQTKTPTNNKRAREPTSEGGKEGGNGEASSAQAPDSELARCVHFLEGLSPEEFASPKCRELRTALRPFFLGMATREVVGDESRTEFALKRALRKQAEGLEAKRRAKVSSTESTAKSWT